MVKNNKEEDNWLNNKYWLDPGQPNWLKTKDGEPDRVPFSFNIKFDTTEDMVKGVIGLHAKVEDIEWCLDDLRRHPALMWWGCMNHYKELYGWSSAKKEEYKIQ